MPAIEIVLCLFARRRRLILRCKEPQEHISAGGRDAGSPGGALGLGVIKDPDDAARISYGRTLVALLLGERRVAEVYPPAVKPISIAMVDLAPIHGSKQEQVEVGFLPIDAASRIQRTRARMASPGAPQILTNCNRVGLVNEREAPLRQLDKARARNRRMPKRPPVLGYSAGGSRGVAQSGLPGREPSSHSRVSAAASRAVTELGKHPCAMASRTYVT